MARLPFNPDRIAPPADPPPPEKSRARPNDQPLTVSQVAATIKDCLASSFPAKLRIVGEVSNFSQRAHFFFSLKDDAATIRCVCFASAARKITFPITDGMEVVVTGRLDFYDAQGNLQIYVDNIEPVGQGALEIRFRALCEELRKLGYFDEGRKKPLPPLPQRVAVVTSRSGAALQDVINTAQRRWAGCQLLLLDVRVQGAAAAPEIADAIDRLSKQGEKLGIDAVILTRGGGSVEDLWAFNERIVADAIYRCRLPIVAAIGHEVDVTIAELVADVRCSTPTQAAMTLIPDRATLLQQVRQHADRLRLVLRRQVEVGQHRLEAVTRNPIFRKPDRILEGPAEELVKLSTELRSALPRAVAMQGERLAALTQQLTNSLPRRTKIGVDRLDAMSRHLRAVSPLNVLGRGYSYTLGPDGRVLRSPEQVKTGDRITSVLAEGKVGSQVIDSTDKSPSRPRPPATPAKSKNLKDGPTLFG